MACVRRVLSGVVFGSWIPTGGEREWLVRRELDDGSGEDLGEAV
jgi:hypothetical protein